jgi:hypothetical protein
VTPIVGSSSTLLLVFQPVLFLLGAALLVAAVRWWRPEVPWRAGVGHGVLVAAFFVVPLFTGALQLPTDLAYRWRPWSDTLERRPRVDNPLQVDILFEQLPFHTLVRKRLLALEAPLWSHEMGAGQPLLANAQSSPFAPLHLMALPLPTMRALTVTIAWQTLLALLLMHALLARLEAGTTGAAFGAVAFAFSTYLIAWAYHPLGMAAAWIPGLLLGVIALRHSERRSFPGLVACGFGLASSGQPETMGYAAVAAAGLAAVLVLHRSPGRGRFAVHLLAAGALTACLSAPILLPVLEQIPGSERMAKVRLDSEFMQPPRFEPRFLLPVLDPLIFGSPRDGVFMNFNELSSTWAGLAALAVAVAGAVAFRGRIAAVLTVGFLSLLAALRVPPFFEIIHALPLVGEGATARLRLFWVLAVAVAGGLSVGRLAEDRRGRIVGAAALIAAGAGLVAFPPPGASAWQTAWWIATLAGAATLLVTLGLPAGRRRFAEIALAVLVLDLFLLMMRYQPVPARGLDLTPPPALAFLMDRARTSPEPFRVLAKGYDLHASLGPMFGLWDARHADPMHPFGSARFIRRRLANPNKRARTDAESYLAVRYRLTQRGNRQPPPWRTVFRGVGGRIWENPEALQIFFMPRRFLRVATPSEALAWTQSWRAIRDFRDLGVAPGGHGETVPQKGIVRRIRPGSNRFDLEVESPTGGVVVSSVSYAPGWRLEIGDRPGEVFEVNSGFLGFEVPPGRHAVHLVYRPLGWTMGLALFGLGLVGMAGMGVLGRRLP